jgi:cytochrome c-type protein NapC
MEDRPNFLLRYWSLLSRGSTVAMGLVLAFGFAAGIVFWGGFNWGMEATNTEAFCLGCHEMKDNVYVEYRERALSHKPGWQGGATGIRLA